MGTARAFDLPSPGGWQRTQASEGTPGRGENIQASLVPNPEHGGLRQYAD